MCSSDLVTMQQRTLGRTGIQVGEIGMGCEGFVGKTAEQVMEMVDAMDAAGVRCIDLYTPNPDVRDHLGRALAGRRDRFVLQGHLGAVWKSGQYKRTRDMAEVREGFADQLRRLGTDRLEIGMIHYSDAMADWETIRTGGQCREGKGEETVLPGRLYRDRLRRENNLDTGEDRMSQRIRRSQKIRIDCQKLV